MRAWSGGGGNDPRRASSDGGIGTFWTFCGKSNDDRRPASPLEANIGPFVGKGNVGEAAGWVEVDVKSGDRIGGKAEFVEAECKMDGRRPSAGRVVIVEQVLVRREARSYGVIVVPGPNVDVSELPD